MHNIVLYCIAPYCLISIAGAVAAVVRCSIGHTVERAYIWYFALKLCFVGYGSC